MIHPIDEHAFDRYLAEWLEEEAGERRPAYLGDVLRQIDGVKQRRTRARIERWLPMSLAPARTSYSPALRVALLLLISLLIAALSVGVALTGASLLDLLGPNDVNRALLVPTLELDGSWDEGLSADLDEPLLGDIGPDGNLYVINGGTNEIVVLSPDGTELRRFGGTGREPGRFDFQTSPSDQLLKSIGSLAVADDGTIYVADTINDRVQHVDGEGHVIATWGGWGPGDGQFMNPFGITVGPDGSVYVVDDGRSDIQRFDPDGTYRSRISLTGSGLAQTANPGFIAVDDDGQLYEADWGDARLQSWGADGVWRWSVGSPGAAAGMFSEPNDVDVDADGNVYVSDAGRVQVFDPEGELRSVFVEPALRSAIGPIFVAVGADGYAYVSIPALDRILRTVITERAASPELLAAESSAPSAASSQAPAGAAGDSPTDAAASGAPGTVAVGAPFAVPFTVELPQRWTVKQVQPGFVELGREEFNDGEFERGIGYVQVYIPQNVFIDPCRSRVLGLMDPPVGPGVDELVDALTSLPGFVAGPVTEIAFGDHAGKLFELDNRIDVSQCDGDPWLPQWTWDDGSPEPASAGPSSDFHQRIAVVDVDGQRVLVEAWPLWADGAAEVIEVFESIRFS